MKDDLASQIADEIEDRRADGAAHAGGTSLAPPSYQQLLADAHARHNTALAQRPAAEIAHANALHRLGSDPWVATDRLLAAAKLELDRILEVVRETEREIASYTRTEPTAGQAIPDDDATTDPLALLGLRTKADR